MLYLHKGSQGCTKVGKTVQWASYPGADVLRWLTPQSLSIGLLQARPHGVSSFGVSDAHQGKGPLKCSGAQDSHSMSSALSHKAVGDLTFQKRVSGAFNVLWGPNFQNFAQSLKGAQVEIF